MKTLQSKRRNMGLWWTIWAGSGLAINSIIPAVLFFSGMLVVSTWIPIILAMVVGLALGIAFFSLDQQVKRIGSLLDLVVAANAFGVSTAVYSLFFGLPLMISGFFLPVIGFLITLCLAMPAGVLLAYAVQKMYQATRSVHCLATIS